MIFNNEKSSTHSSPGFKAMKYGLFVHYVRGRDGELTITSDGTHPNSLNDLANLFDVPSFANDIASTGVEYIIFTAWHSAMEPLYPSRVMNTYRPGRSAVRDLLGELIEAVCAKGIRVLLYTHPYDGYEFTEDEKEATGWGKGVNPAEAREPNYATFNHQKWNDFINAIYGELIDRYGDRIDGLFLDDGNGLKNMDLANDYPRLRNTIKSRYPDLVMIQNFYGKLYESDFGAIEEHHWREFASSDGTTWPSFTNNVASAFGPTWWASVPSGIPAAVFTASDMFKYTVLQAGTNTDGGGVTWAAGPYAGGGWETGVLSTLQTVGNFIAPIAKSVKNTYPSTSYITPQGTTLSSLSWGVATKSTPDSIEYIHVLKAPIGNTLSLPEPADGKIFGKARLVSNKHSLILTQSSSGVTLTLQDGDVWETLDTVIELEVIG
jgi:hypothetical protein